MLKKVLEDKILNIPQREDTLYESVMGGLKRVIGYKRHGVKYEHVMGGPSRVINEIKYK